MMPKFLLLLLLSAGFGLMAQSDTTLQSFNLDRNLINRDGMTILASWSVLNMAWSISQLNSPDPLKQSYHQMNLGWNAVNLAIAGFGLYNALYPDVDLNTWASIDEQAAIKRIFAVNAALDIAYIAGGFYLREYARRASNFDRYEGFGRAVIVNGGFLFAFDVLMYWAHHLHEAKVLLPLMEHLQIGPQGISLQWQF